MTFEPERENASNQTELLRCGFISCDCDDRTSRTVGGDAYSTSAVSTWW